MVAFPTTAVGEAGSVEDFGGIVGVGSSRNARTVC